LKTKADEMQLQEDCITRWHHRMHE